MGGKSQRVARKGSLLEKRKRRRIGGKSRGGKLGGGSAERSGPKKPSVGSHFREKRNRHTDAHRTGMIPPQTDGAQERKGERGAAK